MLFTPLWFWGLCREIATYAVGAGVPGGSISPTCLRLTLRRDQEMRDLVFWLDPAYARAELQQSRGPVPLLGGWEALTGAQCTAVEQPQRDRRLRLHFERGGDLLSIHFIAFGRPTLILEPADAADAAIAQVGTPPRTLRPPEQPFLLDSLTAPAPPIDRSVDVSVWLDNSVRGLDPIWLSAISAAVDQESQERHEVDRYVVAWKTMQAFGRQVEEERPAAFVVWKDDAPIGVSLVDFGHVVSEYRFEPAPSLSAASGRLVALLRKREASSGAARNWLERARTLKTRLRRRITNLEADRKRQLEHDIWRENADWLTAQLSRVKQGNRSLDVPTRAGTRTVPLDPALPPSRQAERWYHRARRLKRGLATTEAQLTAAQDELVQLTELIERGERALTEHGEFPDALRAEFQALPGTGDRPRDTRRTTVRLPYRRFRSPGGLAIWVGRSNRDNDELTLHHAHKRDLWFHAQQTPGSHVVLRSHALKQAPARADIKAAAETAAFFSKARHSTRVPVIYTEARYVRKPRKAPPGQVLVEREKSIMVEPRKLPEWDEESEA